MQLAGNGFLLHLISLFSAEEILTAEGFSLKGKSKSKWLAFYMGIRSAVFDDWTRQQIAEHPNAVVIHLGWGMDSRCLRVGTGNHKWYDVDFPEVIEERKRYYAESDHCRMIPGTSENRAGWTLSLKPKMPLPRRASSIS